jgi:hypothetical protein
MSNAALEKVQEALRDGKRQLRASRRNLSLPEKVACVIQLQRTVLPFIARRRKLKPWEQVWDIDLSRRLP